MRTMLGAAVFGFILSMVAIAPAPAADDDTRPQRVTFAKDVLPIFQENCQVCHRPGGDNVAGMIAPMSLMTYAEVRPWAKSIVQQVKERQMPPWDATKHTAGLFINERGLEDEEIATIVRWVESGAVRGNPADAPEPKTFPVSEGWVIGKPDLYIQLEEPYWVADDIEDVQPRFTITITEEMLPEPRWLKAIECKPDSEVVHHIFSTAQAPAFGDHPEEQFSLASVAAGEDPQQYPDGFGNLLRAGTIVNISMHYHKEAGPGTGVWDRSGIGFRFYPEGTEIEHKVSWGPIGNNGIGNGEFEIPPRHPNWEVGWGGTFEKDTLLLSVHPHMHFRGRDMVYTAFYPNGTTEMLINVDRYDYSWQTIYFYREPKFIPAGTRIEAIAHFDNSEASKELYKEINIDRGVGFGPESTDEMMIPYVSWTELEPGEGEEYRPSESAAGLGSD